MRKQITAFGLMLFIISPIGARISKIDTIPDIPESRCTVPKTAKRDREFNCLKGKVHIVQTEHGGVVKKDGQYVRDWISQETTTVYDEQGNKIESIVYGFDYNRQKSISSRIVYNFNSKGVATGWEDYVPGHPNPAKSIYSFDNKGNRIKETVFGIDGKVRAMVNLIYDSKGNNIEKRYFYSEAIYQRDKEIYEYDGKNLIQTTVYNKDSSITFKAVFTYENGNQKQVISYSPNTDGQLISNGRTIFYYDNKGNMIEKVIYNKDDSIKTKAVYGYDDKGNVISQIIYDSDGKLKSKRTVTFEFDSRGNWIKYISHYTNNNIGADARESYSMETRMITYY